MGVHPSGHLALTGIPKNFRMAEKLHRSGVFRTLDLPGKSFTQPVIRRLDLVTVFDLLIKHAVFIADAITRHRNLEGGATIQKTGRQSPQAAVTQPCITLLKRQILKRTAIFLQGVPGLFLQIQV